MNFSEFICSSADHQNKEAAKPSNKKTPNLLQSYLKTTSKILQIQLQHYLSLALLNFCLSNSTQNIYFFIRPRNVYEYDNYEKTVNEYHVPVMDLEVAKKLER